MNGSAALAGPRTARQISALTTSTADIAPPLVPAQADLSPDPVEVFQLRCEARAVLVANGMMPLLDAVDGLQQAAEATGLIERCGQDVVQQIMATALKPHRSEHEQIDIAGAVTDIDGAVMRRPAGSTIAAFWYLVQLGDPERLKAWLTNRPDDAPALREILELRR